MELTPKKLNQFLIWVKGKTEIWHKASLRIHLLQLMTEETVD